VLVDGQFAARIELPDGSDRWEDWFTWQEEGSDWRRIEALTTSSSPKRTSKVRKPAKLFAKLVECVTEMRAAQVDERREVDGWVVHYKLRPKQVNGSRVGDIRIIDPADGQAFSSVVAVRRKLGLPNDAQPPSSAHSPPKLPAKSIGQEKGSGRWAGDIIEVRNDDDAGGDNGEGGADGDGGGEDGGRSAARSRKRGRSSGGGGEPARKHPATKQVAPKQRSVDAAPSSQAASITSVAPITPPRAAVTAGVPMLDSTKVKVGLRVEVLQVEEGLLGSRFAGAILQLRGKRAKAEALVEYEMLYDEAEENPPDGHTTVGAAVGDAAPTSRLREWVSVGALAPPPTPSPLNWHRQLRPRDEVEVWHEGGWWHVTIDSRVPGNVKQREPVRFVVKAVGYGVQRVVDAANLRPRPSLTGA